MNALTSSTTWEKLRFYIGIDPGLTGAIAVLDRQGRFEAIIDVPSIKVKGSKKELDLVGFRKALSWCSGVGIGVIEDVTAWPGQGVTSMFAFGGTFWAARATLVGLNIPYELVRPLAWKERFQLKGKDKDAARGVASRLFPEVRLSLKKDVNKADALLLARYCWVVNRRGSTVSRRQR